MHLIQFIDDNGKPRRGRHRRWHDQHCDRCRERLRALDAEAAERGVSLREVVIEKGLGAVVDKARLAAEGRLLAPIDHPDRPAAAERRGAGR